MNDSDWGSQTVCRRNDGLLAAAFGEELLMMSINEGRYYNLNGVGARIWELLTEPTTVPKLVDALVAEYAVGTEIARREVNEFLTALQERGLLAGAAPNA